MTGKPGPLVCVAEPGYADYVLERAILAPLGARVEAIAPEADLPSAIAACDPAALLVRERAIDAAVLGAAPSLRAVVRYGVGVDNIDLEAARARGIHVANVPDYGAEHEVSELAVALYLAVSRRLLARDASVRAGRWGVGQAEPIPGRRDATLGLIGFGKIARKAATKFRALGFSRILASDPALTPTEAAAHEVEIATPDALCAAADLVSLHLPLTPETHHIIDRRRLALMSAATILVNVSRGGLVDELALAEALSAGRLYGAGLDVFETEPPAADHTLFAAPNLVLSDHAAWYSETAVEILQRKAAEEVLRVLSGERPRNWVNPW